MFLSDVKHQYLYLMCYYIDNNYMLTLQCINVHAQGYSYNFLYMFVFLFFIGLVCVYLQLRNSVCSCLMKTQRRECGLSQLGPWSITSSGMGYCVICLNFFF